MAEDVLGAVTGRLHPQARQWLIALEGGAGDQQSRLARAIGWRYVDTYAQLPVEERFGVILWASAATAEQPGRAPDPQHPVFATQAGLQLLIATTLRQAGIELPRQAQPDPLFEALKTQRRVLLIIEHLDHVRDPSVVQFLRQLPMPAKALVTTAHDLDIPFTVRLHTSR